MENISDFTVEVLNDFIAITCKPEKYLSRNENLSNRIKTSLKTLYDCMKNGEPDLLKSEETVPNLIVENFDVEQIWQQVDLQNEAFLNKAIIFASKFTTKKDTLENEQSAVVSKEQIQNEIVEDSKDHDVEDDSMLQDDSLKIKDDQIDGSEMGVEEDDEIDGSEIVEDKDDFDDDKNDVDENDDDGNDGDDNNSTKYKNTRSSVVDDEFFKLNEMENFLLTEEKKISSTKKVHFEKTSDSEESVNLFNESDDEDELQTDEQLKLKNPRFKDFFKKPLQLLQEGERRNELKDSEMKSNFEQRQERLKNKIEHLETAILSEKPWQLKGEVTADSRPQNSLLEEVVEFDLTSRPAPVITEQITILLEDVIRQRIKDKAFDDVERKMKPVETPMEYKKKLLLDQEKSKESLAQIYEKQYLQQKEGLEANDTEQEEPQLHKEIKKMMHNLFVKLDALSNFHFTPKLAIPELTIVSNLPAINLEEVAPVAVSNATLLAPQEIKTKSKGDIMGKGERTATDKKRERRKKKQKQQEHAVEKKKKEISVNKLKPNFSNKHNQKKSLSKTVLKGKNIEKMDESLGAKHIKSSTAFFTQLQDEVQSQMKRKTGLKHKPQLKVLQAKRMKL